MSEIIAESDTQITRYIRELLHVTRMFNKGVPEKLIAEKSEHRSLKALIRRNQLEIASRFLDRISPCV